MKLKQKSQKGNNTKTFAKEKQGKSGNNPSEKSRINEEASSIENQEEPTPPTTPRREYEEPGHEHEYRPPTAPPPQVTPEFIGEG